MKTLGGFLAGAVLASAIAYFVVQRNTGAGSASAMPASQPVVRPVVVDPGKPAPASAPAAPETVPAKKLMVAAAPKPQPPPVRETRPAPASIPAETPAPAPTPTPVASIQQSAPLPPVNTAPLTPELRRETPPPPPIVPTPRTITIPAGTLVPVRIAESLSSDHSAEGDTFRATLDQPLVVDGLVIAEKGARAEGRVVEADRAGRVKGVSQLVLELTGFNTADGQHIAIRTESFSRQGPASKKEDAVKVGAGSAIGAALGAIIGGGKGAAIGAGAGGAAGAGDVLLTRGKPVNLPVESRISFRLREPVAVTEKLR